MISLPRRIMRQLTKSSFTFLIFQFSYCFAQNIASTFKKMYKIEDIIFVICVEKKNFTSILLCCCT